MTTGPYSPVSFTSESVTQAKLQQVAVNQQWLFENNATIRYNTGSIVRDTGIKIIAGKAIHPVSLTDYALIDVYFGSFFSASCKPIVVANIEANGNGVRKMVNLWGLGNTEIDSRGFRAHITQHEKVGVANTLYTTGWLHWIALGF